MRFCAVPRGVLPALVAVIALGASSARAQEDLGADRGVARSEWRAERARELRATGERLLAAGDRVSAAGYFREAIQVDPSDGAAYEGLGRIQLARGALAEARQTFEVGLRAAPGYLPLWRALADALVAAGALDDAGRALRTWASRAPRDSEARMALGDNARERGAWAEALASYRAVIALAADGAHVDPATLERARTSAAAIAILAGELDPVRGGCAHASPVRRALARCLD